MKKAFKRQMILGLATALVLSSAVPRNIVSAADNMTIQKEICISTASDYKVSVVCNQVWNGKYSGEILVTNTSDTAITDWALEMLFEGEFESVWNGELISCGDGKYIISSESWNELIPAGSGVSVGFVAVAANESVVPKKVTLISKNDFYIDNNDSLNVSDNFIFKEGLKLNGGLKYNNVDIIPALHDGIVSMLEVDTTVEESLVLQTGTYRAEASLVSNGIVDLSAENIDLADVVIADGDITLRGRSISTDEITVLYSRNGDIRIDADELEYNGIIYAPNGTIEVCSNVLRVNGKMIANSISASYSSAEFMYEEEISEVYNKCESTSFNLVKDCDELYGEYYSIDYAELARKYVLSEVDDDATVTLGAPITLYDVNDRVSSYAFNFSTSEENGYVILGAHSRNFLLGHISTDCRINENVEKIYDFGNGELYYYENGCYSTLDGTTVSESEFAEYKTYLTGCRINISYDMIEKIERNNQAMINQIQNDFESVGGLKTHYAGTDKDAYGYGGISDPLTYLKDRYGGMFKVSDAGKTLNVDSQTMYKVSGKSANNCSLVAITKVLKYWSDVKGKTGIPSALSTIYNDVETIGKGYGYNDDDGTFPTKINNIAKDALKKYGYSKSKSNGIYVWSFSGEVKSEINAGRPVIMNVLRGYYGNHSITVVGYKIYKKGLDSYPMIKVSDGWEGSYRYIDYDAFAYDLVTSGFGSFNTIEVK